MSLDSYRAHVEAFESLFREASAVRISPAMVRGARGIRVEVYGWRNKKKVVRDCQHIKERAERDGFPVEIVSYVKPEKMESLVLLIKPIKKWFHPCRT